MLGDVVEAETVIAKLEQLEPSKQSITAELNDLGTLRKFLKEGEMAYEAKDYRKVVYCMDRCIEVSPYCSRYRITKAECLAYLGRYSEAEMGAKLVFNSYI